MERLFQVNINVFELSDRNDRNGEDDKDTFDDVSEMTIQNDDDDSDTDKRREHERDPDRDTDKTDIGVHDATFPRPRF